MFQKSRPTKDSHQTQAGRRGPRGVEVVPAGPERSYADMMHYLRWEEALGQKYS